MAIRLVMGCALTVPRIPSVPNSLDIYSIPLFDPVVAFACVLAMANWRTSKRVLARTNEGKEVNRVAVLEAVNLGEIRVFSPQKRINFLLQP